LKFAQYAYIIAVYYSGMKHKPVYRKPKEIQKLVNHCIHILLVLLDHKSSVNEIYAQIMRTAKQTGLSSYKYDFLDSVKHLKHGGFITEVSNPKHKQMQIQELTSFGREMAEFIAQIKRYNKSYSHLAQVIKDNFNISKDLSEGIIKNQLRSRGWIDEDIKYGYDSYVRNARSLAYEFNRMFMEGVMWRGGSIFFVRNETKIILKEIIIDEISRQVSFKLEYLDAANPFALESSPLLNFAMCINGVLLMRHNRFLTNEITNVIKSLYFILRPSKYFIKAQPESLRKMLREWEEYDRKNGTSLSAKYKECVEKAIDVYKELITLPEF